MSDEERRRNPRFPVDLTVTLGVAGERRDARLHDLCRDAALVEAVRPEPVGTAVTLEMLLPGASGPMRLAGTVIRLAPGEQGGHGMAILFSAPPPEAEARIDEFVASQGR